MHKDASALLYEALGRDEEEIEEIELFDIDGGYAPEPQMERSSFRR